MEPSNPPADAQDGYFHRLARSCFGHDATGRTLFFRVGPLSQPFVLLQPETEERLRAISATFYRHMVVGSAILIVVFPVLPLYWAALIYWFASQTEPHLRGLPRHDTRLTLAGALRTRAMAYPPSVLACAAAFFVAATVGGAVAFKVTSNEDLRFVLALGLALSAPATAAASAMWRFRTGR